MHLGCVKTFDARSVCAVELMHIPILSFSSLPKVDGAHPIFISSQLLGQVNIHEGVFVVHVQVLTPVIVFIVDAIWISNVPFILF